MKLAYISPSILPSRTANSVHVVMQCDAFIKTIDEVVLYAKRLTPESAQLESAMESIYGVSLNKVRLVTFWRRSNRGDNLKIALLALWDLFVNKWPDVILSRNLYASFVIAVILRRPLLFETHQLELGIRKLIQRLIMTQHRVITIVISDKLSELLKHHHDREPSQTLVLHDAAPEKIEPISPEKRHNSLIQIAPQAEGNWTGVCGYFGHLYAGRGVKIIEQMAKARPGVLFLLFGGNEKDINDRKNVNQFSNLIYMGHVPYPVAQQAMKSVDVLLMPYQESVSIGVPDHDTARWMSPMKMFEYMATGVPIISSDLPVLCEVLKNGKNALLAPPNKSESWIAALDILLSNKKLAHSLGACAHKDYKNNHTWLIRANNILDAARSL